MGLFSSCGQRQGAQEEVREAGVIAGLVGSPGTIYSWRGSPCKAVRKDRTGLLAAQGPSASIAESHHSLEPLILGSLGPSMPPGRTL